MDHGSETGDRLLRIMDAAPWLVFIVDADMKGVYFNEPWVAFTGLTLTELAGDGWLNAIHPEDRRGGLNGFARAFDLREKFHFECRCRHHDGEFRYLSITAMPEFAEDGRFLGYLNAAVDMHPQRIAEDALRQSEMRCRAVFGPSVGNVAVVDSAGTIIGVNDRWLRFAREHGARLKTIRAGANYLEECRNAIRHGSADASVAIRGIAGVLDGSLPEFRLEYACSASSEEQWYELIAHPLRRTEGGAILTHLNVTDRRTAEREAQSLAQELARVSRVAVLGELTASLAHELSQPLTAIHTNAQAALHLFSKKRTPSSRIEGILSDIVADNLRAGKIVRHLRTMLKKGQVRFRQIKLNQLIQDVTELLHDDAILRGVRVSLDLDAGLPPIWGERIQLQQVVLNLMVNAFEAMRRTQNEGRELTVRTSLEGPDHASLQLSDTGPGIPESHLDRIFEPFFTTKSGGLGMGLAICRSIIRAHNGEISVANNPGKGVSFRVKLPLFRQGCT